MSSIINFQGERYYRYDVDFLRQKIATLDFSALLACNLTTTSCSYNYYAWRLLNC